MKSTFQIGDPSPADYLFETILKTQFRTVFALLGVQTLSRLCIVPVYQLDYDLAATSTNFQSLILYQPDLTDLWLSDYSRNATVDEK